jgi:MFS family permease
MRQPYAKRGVAELDQTSTTGRAYRWYVLALLTATYAIQSMDRNVINVLVEPIKHEFHVKDATLGLLTGFGFSAPFALMGLPMGMLVDRVRRQRLLAALLFFWSGLTALGGLSRTFLALLASRAAVGAAEAGAPPTAMALLSDYFPPRIRALAVSVYYVAAPAGVVVGAYFGGVITAAHGWRMALLVAGAPGVLLSALVLLTVREPPRGGLDAAPESAAAPPFSAVLGLVGADRGLLLVVIALVAAAMAAIGIGAWMPAVLMRAYHLPIAKAGALIGLSGLCGAVGTALGGLLSVLFARGRTERLLLIAGVSTIAGVGFYGWVLLNRSPTLPVAPLLIAATLGPLYYGPGFSLALGFAPPAMRGRMMALTYVLCNVFGAGFGPQAVGLLSDALAARNDPHALPHAVGGLGVAGLAAGASFLLAIRYAAPGLTRPVERRASRTSR